MVREFLLSLIAALLVVAAAWLGVFSWLGAHPWWHVSVAVMGGAIGAVVALLLRLGGWAGIFPQS